MDLFVFHGTALHLWSKGFFNGGRRLRRRPLLSFFCSVLSILSRGRRWVRGWVAVRVMRIDCLMLCSVGIWSWFKFCWRTNHLFCIIPLSMIVNLRFILPLLMGRSRSVLVFLIWISFDIVTYLVYWLGILSFVFCFVIIRSSLCFWNDLSIRICWIVTNRWEILLLIWNYQLLWNCFFPLAFDSWMWTFF